VATAEDGYPEFAGPKASGAGADDADHDAAYVHIPFNFLPKRSGSLLGVIGVDYHRNTILRYWLGRPEALGG